MRGAAAACLALLLLATPLAAEEREPAPPPADRGAESCSACTGSLVKSWRIRKGDPKRPPATKSLEEKNKKDDDRNLAE